MTQTFNRFSGYLDQTPPYPIDSGDSYNNSDMALYLANIWKTQKNLQQSVSSFVTSSPEFTEAYFSLTADPIFDKTIQITNLIEAHSYNSDFHNDGSLNLDQTYLTNSFVFFINDFYDYNEQNYFVMVFKENGELIPKKDVKVHKSNGGARLFIKRFNSFEQGKANLSSNSKLRVVAVRKIYSDRGLLFCSVNVNSTLNGIRTFEISNISTSIGSVENTDHLYCVVQKLGVRTKRNLSIQLNRDSDKILVTGSFTNEAIEKIYVINSLSGGEIDLTYSSQDCSSEIVEELHSNLLTTSLSNEQFSQVGNFKAINLRWKTEAGLDFPIHFNFSGDDKGFLVFFNGLKASYSDEFQFDSNNSRLLLSDMAFPSREELNNLRVIMNGASTASGLFKGTNGNGLTYNQDGYPLISSDTAISHVIRSKSLVFANRKLINHQKESLSETLFHVKGLDTDKTFEVISFYKNDSITKQLLLDRSNFKPELQKLLELNNLFNVLLPQYITLNGIGEMTLSDLNLNQELSSIYSYQAGSASTLIEYLGASTEIVTLEGVEFTSIRKDSGLYLVGSNSSGTVKLDPNHERNGCGYVLIDLN